MTDDSAYTGREIKVAVDVQTVHVRCDACGVEEEIVLELSEPDDVLLPTTEKFLRTHPQARRVKIRPGRFTAHEVSS